MINNTTIGITGASGHIGSALAKHLIDKGFRVIGFARNIASIKNVAARKYDLRDSIPYDLFSDIDVLIHCAYVIKQQDADAEQINYNGSKYLFDSCRKQGVKKIIFFSSVTADENAKSGYAKSKFAIEQLLHTDTDFIIKCSMVIGEGGLFQRMLNYTTTHAFIPVIGSGTQIIQLIAIEDVVCTVEQVIILDLKGTGVLASKEELTYKQFFSSIAKVYHKKIFFVPMPAILLKIILRVFNLLNIRTRAAEENIQGMQTLRKHDPLVLLPSFRTLKEKLVELRGG